MMCIFFTISLIYLYTYLSAILCTYLFTNIAILLMAFQIVEHRDLKLGMLKRLDPGIVQ